MKKVPEYVRARTASQYATGIDEWIHLLDAQNNGGYANMWLIGNINTNEIASYEQGLQRVAKTLTPSFRTRADTGPLVPTH